MKPLPNDLSQPEFQLFYKGACFNAGDTFSASNIRDN